MVFIDVSWYGAGLKTLKFSKSVKRESCTWERTVATSSSAMTRRSCSTERTPPALPYPTNPATLLFHSLNRKSIAFFNAPGIPWLYSAVTKTYASKDSIFSDQILVCSFVYGPINGELGSSYTGRLKSLMSTNSKSASLRFLAMSYTHRPTDSLLRPGLVLPRIMATFSIRLLIMLNLPYRFFYLEYQHQYPHLQVLQAGSYPSVMLYYQTIKTW